SLADSSVLFLLATVGLIERVHETSPEAFAMLIMAGAFFCLAWSLDSPRQASWVLGFIVSAAWLCKGMWFGLGLGLAILILVKLSPHWRSIAPVMLPRASLVVVLVLLLWFWLMYRDPVSAVPADDEAGHATRLNWMAAWWTLQLGGPLKGFATRIFDLLREPWWFFWPVWPVAIWAVWSLRDRIREPSLIAPISLIAAMVLFSPVAHGSSLAWFMPIAVPLAALAALGLPSLRRGLVQFVDWYAVLVYGLIALMFWVYYLAWMIGWPEKMAYRMGILARGDQVANIWFGTLAALAISLAWIGIVGWRLSRQAVQVFRQAFNGLQAFGFRTAKTVPGDLFKTADKRLAKRSRTYQVGIFIGLVLDVAKTVSDSVCISEAHRLPPLNAKDNTTEAALQAGRPSVDQPTRSHGERGNRHGHGWPLILDGISWFGAGNEYLHHRLCKPTQCSSWSFTDRGSTRRRRPYRCDRARL
ncbi:MAG: hypothetical protein EBS61_09800, partial [Betaproteobacteria bacterium]|nr:hypothetical protein [Betaproteobacteria bacterium]